MATWQGVLTVDPDLFSIDVGRLIYEDRADRILFDWKGKTYDGGDRYSLSGAAARQMEGHFLSPSISYKSGDVDCEAIIYIIVAEVMDDGLHIEGFWHEKSEGSWKFSGRLTRDELGC